MESDIIRLTFNNLQILVAKILVVSNNTKIRLSYKQAKVRKDILRSSNRFRTCVCNKNKFITIFEYTINMILLDVVTELKVTTLRLLHSYLI